MGLGRDPAGLPPAENRLNLEPEQSITTAGRCPMAEPEAGKRDVVSRIIGRCYQDPAVAETLFRQVIAGGARRVFLPEGEVELSAEEAGEFAARFSAEVEPTLWQSKRRKQ